MKRSDGRIGTAADALLYGGSAIFSGVLALTASISQYREWGRTALWSYLAGALLILALGPGATVRVRAWVAVAVFAGAALLPLAREAAMRSNGPPGLHAQSEVLVTEEAARALLGGRDPYAATFLHGSLAARPYGTKTHFPYLPGMLAFGLPRAADGRNPLADARVWFALGALGALAIGARSIRGDPGGLLRCSQVLLVLPTGALFLATGGDDIPVLGLMFASVVLLGQGREIGSGVLAGVAAALKQTAWPLAPFLFLAARGHRRRFAVPAVGIALAVVAPFAAWNPAAFVEDVVRFPLGLGRERSAAGSPTLGSVLVRALPLPRGVVVAALSVLVLAAAIWLLRRPATRTLRGAVTAAGILYLAATILAPSGRAGYLLYPLELLVWSRFATPGGARAPAA